MKRRTLDIAFSIGGAVFSVLLLVLGLVLSQQKDFAESYVKDQMHEQAIFFKPVDKLATEEDFQKTLLEKLGTKDKVDAFIAEFKVTSEANSKCLVKYAGLEVNTGKMAECYANDFIRLHALESSIVTGTGLEIKGADGKMVSADGVSYTYASISPVQAAAKAAVQTLKDAKASDEEIAAADKIVTGLAATRSTLLTGQTLRGLLLTTYGFSIFGEKGGLAATVCYLAFALLLLLSLLGLLHAFFSKHAQDLVLPAVEHKIEA